jgi:hypothetical protein
MWSVKQKNPITLYIYGMSMAFFVPLYVFAVRDNFLKKCGRTA